MIQIALRRIRAVLTLAGSSRGSATPFVAILLPVLVAFVGLAHDGGSIFVAKREALNVATASARAGAAEVTEASLYQGRPRLAPTAASTASTFATSQGYRARASVFGGGDDKVWVEVQIDVSTLFLGLVGVNQVTVSEDAIAQVRSFAKDG